MDIFPPAFEFLTKLERLNFTKVDNDTLINDDGFTLSYSTKLETLIGSKDDCKFLGLPVQLLFQVRKDNNHVMTWGCEELEDTTMLAKWFVMKRSELQHKQNEVDYQAQKVAKDLWAAL
jgi:hypothetical protein